MIGSLINFMHMKKIVFLFVLMVVVSTNIMFAATNDFTQNDTDSLDLSIQHPKLTVIPDYVFDMKDLRILDVSGNRIGVISPRIQELTKLESLYLSGNHYLKDLPDFLMDMKSLKFIYLEGMKLWSTSKKADTVKRFSDKGIKVVLEQEYGEVIQQE